MFHQLVDAIALYRKAKQQGKEIYIFPPPMLTLEICKTLDIYLQIKNRTITYKAAPINCNTITGIP